MLFSVPVFDTSTYIEPPNSYEYGLRLMDVYDNYSAPFNRSFDDYVERERKSITPLIFASALNLTWSDVDTDVHFYL